MHQRKRLLAQLNMDITCSLDKHGLKIIRKIKKNRKIPSRPSWSRGFRASMGLSFNIHVQPGLKFHSEVVLPDNDPLGPSFHQGLAEGL